MATESSTSSVLAQLMGISRVSPPRTTYGRRRVLSESYVQNIASVVHRNRSSNFESNDFSMDVDAHLDSEDAVEFADRTCLDGHQFWLHGDGNAGLLSNVHNSSIEVRSIPQECRFQKSDVFDLSGRTNLCSPTGDLTVQGSSCASALEKHKLTNSQVWKPKSFPEVNSGNYMNKCSGDWIDVETGYASSSKRMMEMNLHDGKSDIAGRSFSLHSFLSGGRKQKSSCCVRKTGVGIQERRKKTLYNSVDSTIQGSMSSKEIAKQITSQVQHSVWHSCVGVSRSGHTSDTSCTDEDNGQRPSSTCLPDSKNKSEASSSNPIKRSNSSETQRMQKWQPESWRVRKCSQEARTSHGRKIMVHVNGWQAGATRFLSKPMLFPSAWVPRTKARCFTLDRNWCLRPGERNSKLHNNSFGHGDVGSTCQLSAPSLDLEKHYIIDEEVPLISNDSAKLERQKTLEEMLTACDSFSDMSGFSDVESPTLYKACITLNESGDNHLRRENKKFDTSRELQWEQLSAKSSTSILLHDVAPNPQDFICKRELNTSSQPGSPVSSLEGPEACRRPLNLTVESKEIFSLPGCSENDVHGMQTRLHLIRAASSDSGSEGPGMMISSDEGDEGGSLGWYRTDAQITECTSENREFSYLVDVLIESGILMGNMGMDSIIWGSRGFVLNPWLFDFLEKKYGKRTVRERSERRLLFDRINSGLTEIFQPYVGINTWRKPVAKRTGCGLRQELIEEELWALLVNQEEELREVSPDKVYKRETEWLNLDEDVYFIAQEIQTCLIDELVEELVSMVISVS